MDKPPRKSNGREVVEAVVEGSVGIVPIAGSALAVAFSVAMGWAYNKRMQAWFETVAEAISELQGSTIDFEAIAEDDRFVDAVVAASKAAQGTSHAEKLRALRNAVTNSLSAEAPSEELRLRFIRIVDEMTPMHMSLLVFLHDPSSWYERHALQRPNVMMGPKSSIIDPAFPQLGADELLRGRLLSDLEGWRLTAQNFSGMMTEQGIWASATSSLGAAFINFIGDADGVPGD